MNLILVSGRYPEPAPYHTVDSAIARELADADCAVRWIVPNGESTLTQPVEGVRITAVASAIPPFGRVQERLLDGPTEAVLTREIRREMPDLVHLLDYGGCSSVNASWSADRMGARNLVSVRVLPTLCHRGDLMHGKGSDCEDWENPNRCAECCLIPSPRGLGVLGSGLGRILGLVRFPVNPYPTPLDFTNRTELLLGGLQFASKVAVQTDEERDLVASLGIRPERLEVVPNSSLAARIDLYRRIITDDWNGAGGAS